MNTKNQEKKYTKVDCFYRMEDPFIKLNEVSYEVNYDDEINMYVATVPINALKSVETNSIPKDLLINTSEPDYIDDRCFICSSPYKLRRISKNKIQMAVHFHYSLTNLDEKYDVDYFFTCMKTVVKQREQEVGDIMFDFFYIDSDSLQFSFSSEIECSDLSKVIRYAEFIISQIDRLTVYEYRNRCNEYGQTE
jgi:hypothetical protein